MISATSAPRLPIKPKFNVEWTTVTLDCYQIPTYDSSSESDEVDRLIRDKRQLEDLSAESPLPVNNQQDTGFWEKVVRVALSIFNKFMEWLNS
ncbi:unnamed protein product [Leptosia nina]|uniref:Uncharacterized protein n=1 Tax=Leptosia nina TaxID=320188 RepID=A0AAV1JZ39_9NEOP